MSYTIYARVIQTNTSSWYSVVEKTAWHYANGGTWSETESGEHILSMGGSGTSGTLRFKNPQGDYFMVILGVHNYNNWCDVLVDLKPSDTGVYIHPTYYVGDRRSNLGVTANKTLTSPQNGVSIKVEFCKKEGNTSWATITIT